MPKLLYKSNKFVITRADLNDDIPLQKLILPNSPNYYPFIANSYHIIDDNNVKNIKQMIKPKVKPEVKTKKKYKKQTIPKILREKVWKKYNPVYNEGICQCCKQKNISSFHFEAGHKISEANGGPTTLDNLIPLCSLCNKSMGTQNFDYFIKKYMI
jgi:5-methylcytosine-specific restriction endonuclease McrA